MIPLENIHAYLHLAVVCMMFLYGCSSQDQYDQNMNHIKRIQQQLFTNYSFHYNENTQQVSFPLMYSTDFAIKNSEDGEMKFLLKAFSKKNNVYSPSKYNYGEEIRLMLYEGADSILADVTFYYNYALKFNAQKDTFYTIRFIYQGLVDKVVVMEITKKTTIPSNIEVSNAAGAFGERMISLAYELQAIVYSTSFTDTVHIQNFNIFSDGMTLYMTYLLLEAVIVFVIVVVQVKMLIRMLKTDTII